MPAAAPGQYPRLAIASGKGGVGKSTVSLELALALRRRGLRVGLLDADVYGPNLPMMVNLRRQAPAEHLTLVGSPRLQQRVEPLEWLGCKMMSVGFLLGEDQSFGQSAAFVDLLVLRFLRMVEWGELDLLLIDLPPGTGDVQQQVVSHAPGIQAMIVVTPQDVAHGDARRLVGFFGHLGVPLVGGVTNMADVVCPCCHEVLQLWREPAAEQSLWSQGVVELARIPFYPPVSEQLSSVARRDLPGSAASRAFDQLAEKLTGLLNLPGVSGVSGGPAPS